MTYCDGGGQIVGARHPIPDDPTVYYRDGGEIVGCNQLFCDRCGVFVRGELGFTDLDDERRVAEVYDAPDWSRLDFVEADIEDELVDFMTRLYVCRCSTLATEGSEEMATNGQHRIVPGPPWRCHGHPTVGARVRIDALDVSESTHLPKLAEQVLGGADAEQVERVYARIRGTPLAERFSTAVAGCLASGDEQVKRRALEFFTRHPDAPGAARIAPLLGGERSLAGALVPLLRRALAAQIALGARLDRHGALIEIGRAELLRPGGAGPLLEAMVAEDLDWVHDHAVAIARATPEACRPLLVLLQGAHTAQAGRRREVISVAAGMARAGVLEPVKLRSLVERFVDDPAERARILAEIPHAPSFAPALSLEDPEAIRGEFHLARIFQSASMRWYVIPAGATIRPGEELLRDFSSAPDTLHAHPDDVAPFEVSREVGNQHLDFARGRRL